MTPNFVTIFILSILIAFYDLAKLISLEFIGVMLRLFQTLGNFNNTLNLVINSHVHLEKLNNLERNKVKIDNSSYFFIDKNPKKRMQLRWTMFLLNISHLNTIYLLV